jgi:nicotinate-nucleotide adenylyltransferase
MQNLITSTIPYPLSCCSSYVGEPDERATLSPIPSVQVALFGTSADPPTIAHQEIIGWLGSQFNHVAVWAADNPFKTHGASLAQRSHMLELLIAEINPSISQHVRVCPNLSSRRTIETLSNAQKIWDNADFVLVVGADLIAQLPQWYQAAELLAQVKLLIVPRTGSEIEPTSLERLVELGAQISIAPLATPAISSTIIRTNRSAHIQGLTPAVSAYIQQQGLYE